MNKQILFLGTAVLLVLSVFSSREAHAYPEFVRHGYFSCTSCHASPAGGGTLTPYGRSFAAEKLSTWIYKDEEQPLHGAVGVVPEWLMFGGNFRQIQTYVDAAPMREGRWIPMQRDVDACVKVGAAWGCATGGQLPASVAGGKGEPRYGLRKAFARLDVGENLVLRTGRFAPRYGLMIANHTSPVRRGLGFDAGRETDQVEATFVSELIEATAYRDLGRVLRMTGDTRDTEDQFDQAFGFTAATLIGTMSRAGVSYRREAKDVGAQHIAGAFTAIGVSETTFVLAEVDQKATVVKDPAAGTPSIARSAASHMRFGHEPVRGVVPYLLHEVDFKDLRDGRTRKDTYGFGLQWFPRPHFEVDSFVGHVLSRQDFSYATAGYLLVHYYL